MACTLDDIAKRVGDEGKDSQQAYTDNIIDFINDICRSIVVDFDYTFAKEVVSVTTAVRDSWVLLPQDTRKILGVRVGSDSKRLYPLAEDRYFFSLNDLLGQKKGYYRYKWDKTARKRYISFVNVDAGLSASLLILKLFTTPEQFPDEFEEVIAEGALWKFHRMLEGDDTAVATEYKKHYQELAASLQAINDDNVIEEDEDRVLTAEEIEYFNSFEAYNQGDSH